MKPEAQFNSIKGIYKNNATKRGLDWDLTDEHARMLFEGDCHFCGVQPSNTYRARTFVREYSGIDRLDNGKGYTVENTVSCCSICNHAKHTLSESAFKAWIFKAASHLAREIDMKADDGR